MEAAIARYNVVARELAALYVSRAGMANAVLETWHSAYATAVAQGLAYNPAAAQAKSATQHWQTELNKIEGDIEARLVELRYLDQLLLATRNMGGSTD